MTVSREHSIRVNRRVRIPLREIEIRTSRSSGPGGQHANKTESRVATAFDVMASQALGPVQKRRVAAKLGLVVRTVSQSERSQSRNREIALARLAERLEAALLVEKPRVATAPTRAAGERRLAEKRRRADVKASRRRPAPED